MSLPHTVSMDEGSGGPSMSDASTSTRRESYATNVDSEGFVIPNVRWKRAGDPYNRTVMERLKKEQPILYKSMIYRKWDKKNFPGRQYGKAFFKRGVPGSWSMNTFGKSWEEANAAQRAARTQYGYRGYGSYWGRTLGGMAGRAIGSRFGLSKAAGQIGSRLGDVASDYIDRSVKGYFGSGSYDSNVLSSTTSGNLGVGFNTNSLINNDLPTRYLGSQMDESNSICITHTEYIMDLTPPSDKFNTLAFLAINPGLTSTFPWLSNIAQFYEEYMFEQLIFTFKSMITDGNSTATGTVIMATQYNPANPKFSNKQQMENYDFAQSVKVSSDAQHGVECDISKRGGPAIEYVRVGDVPTGQDVKTYDMATFQVAMAGGYENLTVGELWVSYKVRLGKSKIFTPGSLGRQNTAYAYATLTAGTSSAILGTTASVNVVSNMSSISITSNSIIFPDNVNTGKYAIVLSLVQSTVPTSALVITGTNCSVVKSLSDETSSAVSPGLYYFEVSISSPANSVATITLSGLNSLVSTSGELRINQIYSTA